MNKIFQTFHMLTECITFAHFYLINLQIWQKRSVTQQLFYNKLKIDMQGWLNW